MFTKVAMKPQDVDQKTIKHQKKKQKEAKKHQIEANKNILEIYPGGAGG